MKKFDISVIGGGIIGGMLTRELSVRYPQKKIALIEKEENLGMHTSTRNSQVLHAGFYYTTDSIKARLCKEGNKTLTKYCEDNKIPIRKTGKFLVARNASENERLLKIKSQGDINSVDLELMDYDQAIRIEKYLKVWDKSFNFLYSPTTSVADSKGIMKSIQRELLGQNNVTMLTRHKFNQLQRQNSDGSSTLNLQDMKNNIPYNIESSFVINSGGLYADVIAKQFNFGKRYEIWPFKGSYLITNEEGLKRIPQAQCVIYPVPPLAGNYFLGIHTTLTVDGDLKIGPSIFPAMWREQYSIKENFNFNEFLSIIALNFRNVFSKDLKMYMGILIEELKKKNKSYMINEVRRLTTQLEGIPDVEIPRLFDKGRPGIRSQLYDTVEKKMVQDFIVEHDKSSLHLLNVASPGWTCSIPMAEYVCDLLKQNKYI